MGKPTKLRAFTLIELLVVVAIIVALIAILLPSLNRSIEITHRAVCGSNLHQIHVATINYAAANSGNLFTCNGRRVQISFAGYNQSGTHAWNASDSSVDWINAIASVGLVEDKASDIGGGTMRRLPSKVWDCPSREFKSSWEVDGAINAMHIGYQFFGGIQTWQNNTGTYQSRSPVTIAGSKPGWVLAADTTMRIDYTWGGGRAIAYGGMPSHPASGAELGDIDPSYRDGAPAGGNQVFMDGSVQWIPFKEMRRFHVWSSSLTRQAFAWQSDWGDYNPGPNPFF